MFKVLASFVFQITSGCWINGHILTTQECAKIQQNKLKVETCVHLFMGAHLQAMERHLPYGITQCYLPHKTSERACTLT